MAKLVRRHTSNVEILGSTPSESIFDFFNIDHVTSWIKYSEYCNWLSFKHTIILYYLL